MMLYELIAAFVAGIAVAGIAMGLRWLSRGLLPRWIVPAAAGLAMLSYAAWSEYSWFSRVTGAFPPGIEVTWKNEDRAFWRPWSFYKPVVNRLTAIDTGSSRRNPQQPDQVMIDVLLAARWQQPVRLKVVFDCASARRADLIGEKVDFSADGSVEGASWHDMAPDDPTLRKACGQG